MIVAQPPATSTPARIELVDLLQVSPNGNRLAIQIRCRHMPRVLVWLVRRLLKLIRFEVEFSAYTCPPPSLVERALRPSLN